MKLKQEKKTFIYLLIVFGVALLVGGLIYFISRKPFPKPEELFKEELPEETMEELLKRLTPENEVVLTEEEQRELQRSLQQLTPTRSAPPTTEEQQQLEETLKQLTP